MTNYLGLELAPTIAANFPHSTGYVIEPVYIIDFDIHLYIKASTGYSYYEKDSFYINMSTVTQGFFYKIGAGFANREFKRVSIYLGANYIISSYTDHYTFLIPGKYFGDYNGDIGKKSKLATAFEPSFEMILKINRLLNLNIGFHLSILSIKPDNSSYPNYYIPGIGVVDNTSINASFNIGILLKLGGK